MVFISSVIGSLRFAGGLSETDWFQLCTGSLSTGFGWFAYNQNAYCNQVGWRQNQTYQAKNYHLSWISVARDDIRELMSVSVNRINNYMLVATLILGIAANCLMWINNFDPGICNFLRTFYCLTIGQSMMFLSLSIIFGIKGQNSAFVNTMRLLTWELRPENPSDYSHNFLKQVQSWEFRGMKSLLRVPGLKERYGEKGSATQAPEAEAESQSSGKSHKAGEKGYEELEPQTRELIYLERFAHFMRLWVPYEAYARLCIGLGFISLSQGAAYFCLGNMAHTGDIDSRAWTVTSLIVVFSFLAVIIFLQNYVGRESMQYGAMALFMAGPICSLFAVVFSKPQWVRQVLPPAASFVHFLFFVIVDVVLALGQDKLPKAITKKYIEGPHGQHFSYPRAEPEASSSKGVWPGAREKMESSSSRLLAGMTSDLSMSRSSPENLENDAEVREGPDHRQWRHGLATGNKDAPTKEEEEIEDQEAEEVLQKVVGAVRCAVSLAAVLWLGFFLYTSLESAHLVGGSHLPSAVVTELPAKWPKENIDANSISCTGGEVFVATSYSILQLSEGAFEEADCGHDGVFLDVASTCDRRGRNCWPLALMSPSAGGFPRILDCSSQTEVQLLQQKEAAERLALRPRDAMGNGGIALTMQGGRLQEYAWDEEKTVWVPHWRHRIEEDLNIVAIDTAGFNVFKFGSLKPYNFSVVRVENLETGKTLGTWRIPYSPKLLSGCSLSGSMLAVMTNDSPPQLLQVELPGLEQE